MTITDNEGNQFMVVYSMRQFLIFSLFDFIGKLPQKSKNWIQKNL